MDRVGRAVARQLGRVDGFVLVPVEIPGGDPGEALHRWLEEHGIALALVDGRVTVPGPATLALRGSGRGVLVIGPDEPDALAERRLAEVNLHRDRVAEAIGGPLVWAGTAAWLRATAERAPDFWSIRTVTQRWRLGPGEQATASTPWSGPLVDDPPNRLDQLVTEAFTQGDRRNAARLGYLHAASLATRSDFAAARRVLETARGRVAPDDDGVGFDLLVLEARLAALTDDPRVRELLAQARERAGGSPGRRAQVDLVAAHLATAEGRTEEARALLAVVVEGCRAERPFLAARALAALGRITRTGGAAAEAEPLLREALALFQGSGEALGEANVLVELADLARETGRTEQARALLQGALATYRRHGTADGVARVLLRRGLVAADLGDLSLACGDLAAAARIFRKHQLSRDEGYARNRLGWVLGALGRPDAADRELGRALRRLQAVADTPARVGTLLARAQVAEGAGRRRAAARWRLLARRQAQAAGLVLPEVGA